MRHKLLFILLFFLINSFFVSAQTIEIVKEDYISGETFQANLNVDTLEKMELSLVDNESKKISAGFLSFKKEQGKYHVHFEIPELDEGLYYFKYGEINESFNIINGSKAIAVEPPILKLDKSKSTFILNLKNNGKEDVELKIFSENPAITPIRDSILVSIGESRSIYVNYEDVTENSLLDLSYDERGYSVELLVEKVEVIEDVESIVERDGLKEGGLEFVDPTPIGHSITTAQIIEGPLGFKNILEQPLHNVTFHPTKELADIIDFRYDKFAIIKSGETLEQYIWINKNKNAESGIYPGSILIKCSEDYSAVLEIDVEISEVEMKQEESEEPEKEIKITEIKDLDNESIEGGIRIVEEKEVKEDKTKNKIIGLIILIIILLVGGIIVWKLRPKQRILQFNEYVKGKKR